MKDKSKHSSVVDLTQARLAQPSRYPDGRPVPPWILYDPPASYLLKPCQVISLPVKGQASSDTKQKGTQTSLF